MWHSCVFIEFSRTFLIRIGNVRIREFRLYIHDTAISWLNVYNFLPDRITNQTSRNVSRGFHTSVLSVLWLHGSDWIQPEVIDFKAEVSYNILVMSMSRVSLNSRTIFVFFLFLWQKWCRLENGWDPLCWLNNSRWGTWPLLQGLIQQRPSRIQ